MQNSSSNLFNTATEKTGRVSPHCQISCKTCLSIRIEQIHKMRLLQRMEYRDISDKLKKDYGEEISASSLCRHFKKYNEHIINLANTNLIKYTNAQADYRSEHTSKLDTLINSMFDKLAQNWGTITPSIEALAQLVKLRYQVMEGQIDPDDFNVQIKALIQNAEKIDNVASQAKFIFNTPNPAPAFDSNKK